MAKEMYSAKKDMAQDKKMTKGLKPKADLAMDKKKPSAKADMKMDKALVAKIKKKK